MTGILKISPIIYSRNNVVPKLLKTVFRSFGTTSIFRYIIYIENVYNEGYPSFEVPQFATHIPYDIVLFILSIHGCMIVVF